MRIFLIGLGNMGFPIGVNLRKAGYDLYVYDIEEFKCRMLAAESGAVEAHGLQAAGYVEVVILSLPSPRVVSDVVREISHYISPGSVVADLSTIDPGTAKSMAKVLEEKQAGYIDAPVSGGVNAAKNGTLTFLVGGKIKHFEKIGDVLKAIGKEIFYMGEVGSGSVAKLINNAIFSVNTVAIAEGLALALKAGVNIDRLVKALSSSSSGSYALNRNAPRVLSDNYEAAFSLDLAVKDITLALKMAEDLKHGVFLFPLAQQLFIEASNYLGSRDVSSISQFFNNIRKERVRFHETIDKNMG